MLLYYIFKSLCVLMVLGFSGLLVALLIDTLEDTAYSVLTKIAATVLIVPLVAFMCVGAFILVTGG